MATSLVPPEQPRREMAAGYTSAVRPAPMSPWLIRTFNATLLPAKGAVWNQVGSTLIVQESTIDEQSLADGDVPTMATASLITGANSTCLSLPLLPMLRPALRAVVEASSRLMETCTSIPPRFLKTSRTVPAVVSRLLMGRLRSKTPISVDHSALTATSQVPPEVRRPGTVVRYM